MLRLWGELELSCGIRELRGCAHSSSSGTDKSAAGKACMGCIGIVQASRVRRGAATRDEIMRRRACRSWLVSVKE